VTEWLVMSRDSRHVSTRQDTFDVSSRAIRLAQRSQYVWAR